jgi:hypothetical protein
MIAGVSSGLLCTVDRRLAPKESAMAAPATEGCQTNGMEQPGNESSALSAVHVPGATSRTAPSPNRRQRPCG